MKSIFGLLFVAALAVLAALLLGNNPAVVSLFWPPWRIDVSFNLLAAALLAIFVLGYAAWRGIAVLRELPRRARRWRALQHQRATTGLLLQAWAHGLGGRFVRAQAAAREAITRLETAQAESIPDADLQWVLAHWVAAHSANALGQTAQCEALVQAVAQAARARSVDAAREGLLLAAAQWALDQRDTEAAARWLAELPQGTQRRIQAVRLRLRLAQAQHDHRAALDLARLLAKHRAFSGDAAASLLRRLWIEALRNTQDASALLALWRRLQGDERRDPRRALALLRHVDGWPPERWADSGDDSLPQVIDEAIRILWAGYAALSETERQQAVACVERWLPRLDGAWLARLEEAQQRDPADAALQYLAGQAYRHRGLWGKAQALLQQAARALSDRELRRRAWCALADLAQARGDATAALEAWQAAARS